MSFSIKKDRVQLFSKQAPLILESGQSLGPIHIAYECYGKLNSRKDNAILLCHALTHGAQAYSSDENTKGWWQDYIGPGKCLDTEKYAIFCSNILGSCYGSTGPKSTRPNSAAIYGPDFPVITVHDMVKAQKALMNHLEIPQWQLVVGGSLGGLQALVWSIEYPKDLKACALFAGTSQVSAQAVAFDSVGFKAITEDPQFQNGNYKEKPVKGMAIARMLAHITYSSSELFNQKFGRSMQDSNTFSYQLENEFKVESYLKYQGEKFINRFDANTYLILKKALSYFDLPKHYGSLKKAFENVEANYLIVAITSDWLYTPEQSRGIANALMQQNKEASYVEINSLKGHDGLFEYNTQLATTLESFMRRLDVK